MTKKTIPLCGKEVTLSYNFAAEIAYFDLTGQDFSTFFVSLATALRDKPATEENILSAILSISPKLRIMAILSCIMSYYQSTDEEPPVTDRALMQDATPEDLMTALATVMQLHNDWYHLPASESSESPSSDSATVPDAAASGKGKGRAPGKN